MLGLAVLALLVVAWSASADRGVPAGEKLFSLEQPRAPKKDSASWPLADAKSLQALRESGRKAAEAAEERNRWLASPAAEKAREQSRTAHLGLSGAAARQLVAGEFGDLLKGSRAEGGIERVAGDRPVAKFLSDHVAVLAGTADEPPVLVDSPTRLRVADEDGRKAAVDLDLAPAGEGFAPVNPLVDLQLPGQLGEGVAIGQVRATPAGAATGVLIDGADGVAYPNAQLDTDVVVSPRTRGAEIFWQLRSPRAAEELTLDLEVPEGAVVESTETGSAAVSRDGKTLSTISAPVAVDAQEQDVPVKMTVSGNRLVVSIEHREADVAYPILVDPVLEDYGDPELWQGWLYQEPYAISRLNEWDLGWGGGVSYGQYIQRHHCYAPVSCYSAWFIPNWTADRLDIPDGLHIYGQSSPISYPAGGWAQYVYEPPGSTTQVEAVDMMLFYSRRGGNVYPDVFTGIYSATAGWVSIDHRQNDYLDWISHEANTSAPGRRSAVFGMYSGASVSNPNWRDGYVGGAQLLLTDPEAPTISGGQLKRKVGPDSGWENRDNVARWISPKHEFAIRPNVSDPGLGVRSVVITGPGGINNGRDSLCTGVKNDRCPANWPEAGESDQIGFSIGGLSDGPHNLMLNAWDPIIRGSQQTFPVKVDSVQPVLADGNISGSLWAAREQPSLTPEQQPVLTPGSHNISFSAQDVGSGVTASGVEWLHVLVDGQVEARSEATCPGGNCSRSMSWSYNTNEFGGRHKIELVAYDGAGNEKRRAFYVNAPSTGDLVYPDDGEITSGKVALLAKDNDDDFTGVRFEYRRRPIGTWTTINSYLTDDQGAAVTGSSHALTEPGRHTKKLIWDVRSALGALTPKATKIQVRAVFTGGPQEFKSRLSDVELDDKGISADNAKESVGPGAVDLLTGNLSISAADASLSSFGAPITVERTFNSLDPNANPNGPFGPGWVISAPMDGVSGYSSLVVLTDPSTRDWVDVFDSAGQRIRFEKTGETTFRPQVGFESLTLTRVVTSGQPDKYTLTDLDGAVTTFITLAGTSKFVPSKVERPDSQGIASYNYEAYLGEPRLKRVVAPAPPGTNCDQPSVAATSLPTACRVLEFVYEHITSIDVVRLRSIQQVAYDGTQMDAETVAYFRYHSGEHLGRLAHALDPRISPEIKTVYDYTGLDHRIGQVTPPGEAPWVIGYAADATGAMRLDTASRTADGSGAETWRMRYQVPLTTAAGGPYNLAAGDLAAWGQTDRPTDATAILPPTETGTSYSKAAVLYLNQDGRVVNNAAPGGRISVTEYDPKGNVVRELSASNRAAALAAGGGTTTTATRAGLLSTYRTYQASGLRLVDELGPERSVKLDSGQVVDARPHTVTTYDEPNSGGSGPPQPTHLATTVATGAKVGAGADVDVRTTRTEFDWTLRKPTRTTVDPGSGNLNITSQTAYNSAGLDTESRQPKSGGADAGTTRTIYYSHDASAPDAACRNRPQWFNLPCKTLPAAQPGTSGLPSLPVTTFTYDRYGNVLTASESVDGATRTTTNVYDVAGRKTSESIATGGGGGGSAARAPGASLDGLVAAYSFDEGSGSSVADSSGEGNGGTISGATWAAGKFGSGLSFDGVNDYVQVPDDPSLDLTRSMTLSAWVKIDDIQGRWQDVIFKEHGSDGAYALEADQSSGGPSVGINDGSGWDFAEASSSLPENQWVHLAGTWDGGQMSIYVNGDRVASSGFWGELPISNGPLRIGGTDVFGGNQHVDGAIDEVRVYDSQLSEAEIEADMAASVAAQTGAGSSSTTETNGLVAAYDFEEDSGSQVVDRSGEGNVGTLAGAMRTASGRHGKALQFDGVDDSVAVPDSNSLNITGDLTVSAWVKLDEVDTGRWQDIVFKERDGDDGAYALDAEEPSGPFPTFSINDDGDWTSADADDDPVAENQWTHIAGVWDGEWVFTYVDGRLADVEAGTALSPSPGGILRIGGSAIYGDNQFLDGTIDDVRIYDRDLSQHEIRADKNSAIIDQLDFGATSGALGEPVPTTTYGYSATTGKPTTITAGGRTVTTAYDNVGRVTGYTDADGTTATTTYDKLSRPVTTNDGKGTQTRGYDATTGLLTSLNDSHAGTFTASYDADGRIVSHAYPNGLTADVTYDAGGAPTRLKYTKTTDCSSACVWVDEQVKESIHGQWRTHGWELSSQEYSYDKAGRLTKVEDDVASPAAVAGCTIRSYAFDQNSNRTSMNTKAPASNGDCQPGVAGTTKGYAYDSADRLTGTGVQYDRFGRMTSVPGQHAGGGALSYVYYANDQIRTMSQDGVSKTYDIDPTARQRKSVATGGTNHTETLHYQDPSDSPSWINTVDAQGQEVSWQRNVVGIDGSLVAVRVHNAQGDTTLFGVKNLHGDAVGTASSDPNATQLNAKFETDEFGNARQGSARRWGYLGAKQRRAELASGVIQMGVRSYIPSLGRFTSVDPVEGGSATDYDYANADPVNNFDLDGRQTVGPMTRVEAGYCSGGPGRNPTARARRAVARAYNCGVAAGAYAYAVQDAAAHFRLIANQRAFRHCLWSGILVQYMSNAAARGFGNRHEQFRGNPRSAKRAALRNNLTGRAVGNAWAGSDNTTSQKIWGVGLTCFQLTKTGALMGSVAAR